MSCSVGAFNAAYHTKIGVYHREMGIKKGGKLVVIGSKLDEKAIAGLFGC